jgi:DinB superfamily
MAAAVRREVKASVRRGQRPRRARDREQALNPSFVRRDHTAYDFRVNATERAELIRQYREGYRVVREALEGITEAELDRGPDNEWTPREIVQHLGDAELIGAERLRRLLAEREPVIQGYDEARFTERLPADRPVEPSLEAMRWARESTVQLLDRMTEADWSIVGRHTESGRYGTEDWLRSYAAHAIDHAEQIRRARGRA